MENEHMQESQQPVATPAKKAARLFFVRCNGDGSWLTWREPIGKVFAINPTDPMLVSEPVGEWHGAYELIPTPFTADKWPVWLGSPHQIAEAIMKAKDAVAVADSYDSQRNALLKLLSVLGETLPDCTCSKEIKSSQISHADDCPCRAWEEKPRG